MGTLQLHQSQPPSPHMTPTLPVDFLPETPPLSPMASKLIQQASSKELVGLLDEQQDIMVREVMEEAIREEEETQPEVSEASEEDQVEGLLEIEADPEK